MQELQAAKEWRLTPSQWRAQSADDKALMLAFLRFTATRENYSLEWREEQRKKKEKGRNEDGPNPYELMRKQMGL